MSTTSGEMKVEQFYKVTIPLPESDAFRSVLGYPPAFVRHYRIGRTTRPCDPLAPLMAFERLEDAREFTECLYANAWVILRGEGVRHRVSLKMLTVEIDALPMQLFWQLAHRAAHAEELKQRLEAHHIRTMSMPTGTVLLDWFKPLAIEEVRDEG